MRTRTITEQDRQNAARLKALWLAKKGSLNLTQQIAAKRLGCSQSMISQALNCQVALTTDAIIGWAQLLKVEPADIDPKLGALGFSSSPVRPLNVAILARMSGEPVGPFETVEVLTRMTRQVYGVSVDTDGFGPFAKKGSTLIISQEEEPVSGDEVFIRLQPPNGSAIHLIKTYLMTDLDRQVAVVRDLHSSNVEEYPLDQVELLDPILSVERPRVNRPIRLRHRHVADTAS